MYNYIKFCSVHWSIQLSIWFFVKCIVALHYISLINVQLLWQTKKCCSILILFFLLSYPKLRSKNNEQPPTNKHDWSHAYCCWLIDKLKKTIKRLLHGNEVYDSTYSSGQGTIYLPGCCKLLWVLWTCLAMSIK